MPIILGPPGTGKTTRLLALVEWFLSNGVPPDRIGFFAFTRKAAHEAINRAVVKFGLEKEQLPFFRTLHSLAYQQLGVGRNQLMTTKHYQDVAKWLKISGFVATPESENSPFIDFGYGDKFLELIGISRLTKKPLREVYNRSMVPLKTDWSRVDYVDRGLRHYKKSAGLYDYTDLLEQFNVRELAPKLDVVIVDEAQDLCSLQWEMVRLLAAKAKHVYIAGDDDQAIYRWAGADIEHFIRLDGQVEILDRSYRIPSSHHELSQKVLSRVHSRRPKEFGPRSEVGSVQWHRHSEEVDVSSGQWLLMARTKRGANQLEAEVRQRGYLYTYHNSRSIDVDVVRAVRLWEALRSGDRVTAADVRHIYKYMNLHDQVEYGHKSMPNGKDGVFYSISDLMTHHGLMHTLPWNEGMGRIPDPDRRYLEACFRKGEKLDDNPRITISTIHAAKGGEADNVLLLTDNSSRGFSMWRKSNHDPEDEARVFYVGLTRSRNNLHLVHPMFSEGYSLPH
jgi:superfamily I DNA/RNA helicase